MNNALKTFSPQGQRAPDMTIDWEMQPSLQHLVRRADADLAGPAPTWAETMPISLEAMREPAAFREPLEGLAMRDIDEPEIFRVFFGNTQAAGASA